MSSPNSREMPGAPSPNRKPLAPWCARLANRKVACPLCASSIEIKITKKGRPYLSCPHCVSRLFVNSELGGERLAAIDRVFPAFRGVYVQALKKNYRDVIEGTRDRSDEDALEQRLYADKPKVLALSRQIRHDSAKSFLEGIARSGAKCLLCGGLAEWRSLGEKGHFQICRFCACQLFLHSPLALAGIITRAAMIQQMYKRLQAVRAASKSSSSRTNANS
jgi:hypothetical protein